MDATRRVRPTAATSTTLPDHVPAQPSSLDTAGDLGGSAGQGLLPLECDGQLRVDRPYANRYGLYYEDYRTQERTPKLSAAYREVIARNAVV